MNKRQSAALSNQSRSETIECAGYELVTTLTCEPDTDGHPAAWLSTGTLTQQGTPIETESATDVERHSVWNALLAIVKGVGYETGIRCTWGKYEWCVRKQMTDEEVEKMPLTPLATNL